MKLLPLRRLTPFCLCVAAGLILVSGWGDGFRGRASPPRNLPTHREELATRSATELKTATFGGGCFWCVEAIFQELRGVKAVVSGFSGGAAADASYDDVAAGRTAHAEVVQISFDPSQIAYEELLEVFWRTHDPTTVNRQGVDIGPQYRSIIFYHDQEQRQLATEYKRQLESSGVFSAPIVTEIQPFVRFYPAAAYHQNYFSMNANQSYCRAIIAPKIEKFRREFRSKLRAEVQPAGSE